MTERTRLGPRAQPGTITANNSGSATLEVTSHAA